MEKACIAFKLSDLADAWEHMDIEIVKDYGDFAYGHLLHTWDDGKRMLARCKKCGGYILIQKSEFHSFSDFSSDSYYTDYFPVGGFADADKLNREYDGFSLESEFPSRYICRTNGVVCWSKQGG